MTGEAIANDDSESTQSESRHSSLRDRTRTVQPQGSIVNTTFIVVHFLEITIHSLQRLLVATGSLASVRVKIYH